MTALCIVRCSGPEVTQPAQPLPPKTWIRGESPPSRWLMIHIMLDSNRLAALNETWREAGITFPSGTLGFVPTSPTNDLAVALTGLFPADGSGTAPSPFAKPTVRWRIMTDNPTLSFQRFLKASAPQSSQGVVTSDVVGSMRATLAEDWKFCLFSFDSRLVASNPTWERDLFALLGQEEVSHNTGIILFTEFPGSGKLIETSSAKGTGLATKARLSSKLKQSKKYELIFTRQETGKRAHYISTAGISSKNPETLADAPQLLTALENTYSASGPDVIAVTSRSALLERISGPVWFWTPQLREASHQAQPKIFWADFAPFVAYSLGVETNPEKAGEMFTAWLLRR